MKITDLYFYKIENLKNLNNVRISVDHTRKLINNYDNLNNNVKIYFHTAFNGVDRMRNTCNCKGQHDLKVSGKCYG